jgi:hypothetical protein
LEIRGSSSQFVVPGSTDQRSDTTGRTEVATPTGLSVGALATLVSGNFWAWGRADAAHPANKPRDPQNKGDASGTHRRVRRNAMAARMPTGFQHTQEFVHLPQRLMGYRVSAPIQI